MKSFGLSLGNSVGLFSVSIIVALAGCDDPVTPTEEDALIPSLSVTVPSFGIYGTWTDVTNIQNCPNATKNDSSDDSYAFQCAIDNYNMVFVPAGKYVVGDIRIRSNRKLYGEGPSSYLCQAPGSKHVIGTISPSTSTSNNIHHVELSDIMFTGCDQTWIDEHHHLVAFWGVSDLIIDAVRFEKFRGDGLYLGGRVSRSSGGFDPPRHNHRVLVEYSVFDGVDRNNRNGISVVDGQNITIRYSQFILTTRNDMPGAIDIEPDVPTEIARRIDIHQNSFFYIGGNVAAIATYFDHTPSYWANIRITNNYIYHTRAKGIWSNLPSYHFYIANNTLIYTN